jgi:hypothetical protein
MANPQFEREKEPVRKPDRSQRIHVDVVDPARVSAVPQFPGEGSNEALTLKIVIPLTVTRRRFVTEVGPGFSCDVNIWTRSLTLRGEDMSQQAVTYSGGTFEPGSEISSIQLTQEVARYDPAAPFFGVAIQVFDSVTGEYVDYNSEVYERVYGEDGVPTTEPREVDIWCMRDGTENLTIAMAFDDHDPTAARGSLYTAKLWCSPVPAGSMSMTYHASTPDETVDNGPLPGAMGNWSLPVSADSGRVGFLVKVYRVVAGLETLLYESCQIFSSLHNHQGVYLGQGTAAND